MAPGIPRSTKSATSASSPTSTPARPPRPSASFILHRPHPQDRRGARRRDDHRLDAPGARARHHDHRGRHLLQVEAGLTSNIRSTSSTPPATWTSRPRSSARCACWTAPSSCFDGVQGVEPAVRDRLAPGRQVPRPRVAYINKMDRIGRRFLHVVSSPSSRCWAPTRAHPASDRLRRPIRGPHRPDQDEGPGLAGRGARRQVGRVEIPADMERAGQENTTTR